MKIMAADVEKNGYYHVAKIFAYLQHHTQLITVILIIKYFDFYLHQIIELITASSNNQMQNTSEIFEYHTEIRNFNQLPR